MVENYSNKMLSDRDSFIRVITQIYENQRYYIGTNHSLSSAAVSKIIKNEKCKT